MIAEAKPKASLRQRVITEVEELSIVTGYLFVVIFALNMLKSAVLHSHGVDVVFWGVSIVKALLLAKFIALGKALKLGEHSGGGPLIWPTLRKSFAFLVFLIMLTMIEEIVVGYFRHRTMGESLSDLFGPRLPETLANILVLLLVLIPYFAFEVLADALGDRKLVRMFLMAEPKGSGRGT